MNYDAEAKRIANQVHAQHLHVHRGVTLLSQGGVAAVFGNDDFAHDPTTREEVRLLFENAARESLDVLGFATDDVGHSAWAMVVRCDDLARLRSCLHEASYRSHMPEGELQTVEAVHPSAEPGAAGAEWNGHTDAVYAVPRVAVEAESETKPRRRSKNRREPPVLQSEGKPRPR